MKIATVVVLLDENAVLGNIGEFDVVICDVADLASLSSLGLDAETVDRFGNLGVGEGDAVNGVVATAAYGTDGETVSTRAETVLEGDLLVKG